MTLPKQKQKKVPHILYSPENQQNQTWLEINKKAIDHNIAYYKTLIGHNNTLAVVVKSNAYGHGLSQIGKICQENKLVDWLCVANFSEAIALQKEGATKPMLVLGYANTALLSNKIDINLKHIAFMVDNINYTKELNKIGKSLNCIINVHIKIDTGLSRLGIFPDKALDFIKQLQTLPFISINGIFSHFASSDKNPDYTKYQQNQFIHLLHTLDTNNIVIPNIHMSNSAAITNTTFPKTINFFRTGLGMYGFGNAKNNLKPVLTWKTRIVAIKTIPTNTYVGYDCIYKTTQKTRIAIIPIGYYDGYDIRFSNNAFVRINNTYAPVIGRIAMNMTTIDVTQCSATVNDEVIVMGDYPYIRADDLAQKAHSTNVREIITGIKNHIPRIVV